MTERAAPYGPYRAIVTSVTDGDTLKLAINLGFTVFCEQSIRLRDVNAPELRGAEREAGLAAREFLAGLLPLGSACSVTTYKDKMSFARYVADVMLADGRDLGAVLVEAGHAQFVNGREA